MSLTNFCCRSGGSNLNAGTRTGSTTEPGTAADFTYASGNWVQATGVFTVASGNPSSDGVAVGDFASVYADGSTVTGFVGRVTARDATTITVSLTSKSGTAPTNGTGNRTLKIGGAWKGPNGAEAFPYGFIESALKNAAGDYPRINFKNDSQYNITAQMTQSTAGPVTWRGYTTAYGDGGLAVFDGGSPGTPFQLLATGGSASNHRLIDLVFQNNGGGTTALVNVVNVGLFFVRRCKFLNGGFGIAGGVMLVECEAAGNGANGGFLNSTNSNNTYVRCAAHDNSGPGFNWGPAGSSSLGTFIECVSFNNTGSGGHGASMNGTGSFKNCDFYNNGGTGIVFGSAALPRYVENCNFVKNGQAGTNYGYSVSGGNVYLFNCAFGSGSQANGAGNSNITGGDASEVGSITLASGDTPWVDPANGNFEITLAACKGTGRGDFLETSPYVGTVGYPDVGAAQSKPGGLNPINGMIVSREG